MSKREEGERARMMAMLPDEGAVAVEIFETASKLGEPGDAISPELAELASQVAGAEAATRWLKAGRSMDDCGTVRRFYEYVGQQIAADVGPGGRLNGATISSADDDEDAAPPTERPYGRTFMNDAPTCFQWPCCFTNQVTLTANFWRMPLTLKG